MHTLSLHYKSYIICMWTLLVYDDCMCSCQYSSSEKRKLCVAKLVMFLSSFLVVDMMMVVVCSCRLKLLCVHVFVVFGDLVFISIRFPECVAFTVVIFPEENCCSFYCHCWHVVYIECTHNIRFSLLLFANNSSQAIHK